MKRKRLLALLLTGIMTTALLAGCGGSGEEETTKEADANGDKTTITIWTKDRHDANYIQEKVDAYNESNTDNVVVEYQLYTDNFDQAVDLAVQSGELPDILTLNDQVYNKYVNQGQWLDLYEYMDEDMREFDTLDFKKPPQSLEIGVFFCQFFCFYTCSFVLFVV